MSLINSVNRSVIGERERERERERETLLRRLLTVIVAGLGRTPESVDDYRSSKVQRSLYSNACGYRHIYKVKHMGHSITNRTPILTLEFRIARNFFYDFYSGNASEFL